MSSYADILAYGLPDNYLNEFVGKVEALTLPQPQAGATKPVHPDALTWLVVGDSHP
jgi:zinc protease